MGTRSNRINEAVLTCTHNICFEQKYDLRYSKNGGNLGLVFKDKKWKFLHKSYVVAIY